MDMNEGNNIWANTTSASVSPPQPVAAFISTQLSFDSRLHLLSNIVGEPEPPRQVQAGTRPIEQNLARIKACYFLFLIDLAVEGVLGFTM
jgi:hypothetical protein